MFFFSSYAVVCRLRPADFESVTRACVGVGGWLELQDEEVNKEWAIYLLFPSSEMWR